MIDVQNNSDWGARERAKTDLMVEHPDSHSARSSAVNGMVDHIHGLISDGGPRPDCLSVQDEASSGCRLSVFSGLKNYCVRPGREAALAQLGR